jgi:hypothetical protein
MPVVKRPLLLCVLTFIGAVWLLTLFLWIRSYSIQDFFLKTEPDGHHTEIVTIPGQARVTIGSNWETPHPWRYYRRWPPTGYRVVGQRLISGTWYFPGFAISDGSMSYAYVGPAQFAPKRCPYRTYAISFDLPLFALSLFPAWLVFTARRRRLLRADRNARGHCTECGYDLRASSGHCPECGAPCKAANPGAH